MWQIYLHYNNAYHRQAWQDDGLLWWACTPRVTWLFDHIFCEIATVPKATKLGRMVTSLTRVLPIKSDGSCVSCSYEILWRFKNTSTITMLMVNKCDRVLTYYKRLPLITSPDPSIMWSCEVMWQIKYSISSLALGQWPPITARWWLLKDFHHH